MKANAIVRIVLFSLAIIILAAILLGVLAFNLFVVDGKIRYDHMEAVEAPVAIIEQGEISAQIRNIEIEWAAGSITIQPDEKVQSIHVTEYCPSDSDYEMVMKQSGQTLDIRFCKDSLKLSSFGTTVEDIRKDLIIVVPVDWVCNSIEIDAAATDVDIHDLRINELDFDGASGNLILDNCSIVELDIDTASGDVEFTGTLNDLDFDAASAKFTGEFFQVPNHLNLDAMSGDLDIILPEHCWFTCELDTMSGSFNTDFATTQENGIHVHGNKDNACHIKISALSGDVRILKGIPAPAENCDH